MQLYYSWVSPACRSVLLAAKHYGVELQLTEFNLNEKEHLKDKDFLAINPQHCVPTIKDGDFVLWESRAILQYLANSYEKSGDKSYPKDPKARALVDKMLFTDMALYASMAAAVYPVITGETKVIDSKKLEKVLENLTKLDSSLASSGDYVAGKNITIADFALVATISVVGQLPKVEMANYKNLSTWFQRCKSSMAGYEEANGQYVEKAKAMLQQRMAGVTIQ